MPSPRRGDRRVGHRRLHRQPSTRDPMTTLGDVRTLTR